MSPPAPPAPAPRPPALTVAAALVAVQAVASLVATVALLVAGGGAHGARQALGAGLVVTLLLLAWAAGLGMVAWGLARLRRWSWSPALLAEALILLLSWGGLHSSTRAWHGLAAATAVVCLVCLSVPAARVPLGHGPGAPRPYDR